MQLTLTIDGIRQTVTTNPDKSLEVILMETFPEFPVNNSCTGSACGNCVVMVDNSCVLSCLVPAYSLEGSEVTTYAGFRKTRQYRDIERAYSLTGCRPCQQCYASKTLLIESILEKAEANKRLFHRETIVREMGLNSCQCMDADQLYRVVHTAWQFRSRRNG